MMRIFKEVVSARQPMPKSRLCLKDPRQRSDIGVRYISTVPAHGYIQLHGFIYTDLVHLIRIYSHYKDRQSKPLPHPPKNAIHLGFCAFASLIWSLVERSHISN